MPLPSSGPISLNDIANEFKGSIPHSLSEYYGVDTGVPASGTISLSDFYGKSILPTNALESLFTGLTSGSSIFIDNVTSRAGCFGRDGSFNYENFVWITQSRILRKYVYNGMTWDRTLTSASPIPDGLITGLADNGTHVMLTSTTGWASIYSKINGLWGTARATGTSNAQGCAWDGQQWLVTSFADKETVYRINADNTATLGQHSILSTSQKRGLAYDHLDHRLWSFATNSSDDQTFGGWNGSAFGAVTTWTAHDSNITSTEAGSTSADEGDLCILSTGERFLVQFDSGNIRIRAKMTNYT